MKLNGKFRRNQSGNEAVTSSSALLPASSSGGDLLSDVTSPPPPTTRLVSLTERSSEERSLLGEEKALMEARAMAERGRKFSEAIHQQELSRRLVQKSGDCNVAAKNVMKRKRKFLVDLFTTMVDMRWRWHIVAFVAVFVVTWTAFACVWWVIALVHGDLGSTTTSGGLVATPASDDDDNNNNYSGSSSNGSVTTTRPTVSTTTTTIATDERIQCVENVVDFRSALLFSIETQATIGYGYRVIQTDCVTAMVLLMLQTCVGLFIQALATGIIFAKISRPKNRAQTILFSRRAVVCRRDGQYCLLFRVGDMRRRSHIIGTSMRALLVRNRLTAEGESLPLCQSTLTLETDAADCFVFLVWPVTVVHRIDESSPLWDVSADDLLTVSARFEIIVILEGTIESTGMLTQVRTSYLPTEICWGERLCPLMTFQRQNGRYEIDYEQFHQTTPIASMPDCSAKEWASRAKTESGEGAAGGGAAGGDKSSDYPISFTTPAIRSELTPRAPAPPATHWTLKQLIQRNKDRLSAAATNKRHSQDNSLSPTQPAAAAAAGGVAGAGEMAAAGRARRYGSQRSHPPKTSSSGSRDDGPSSIDSSRASKRSSRFSVSVVTPSSPSPPAAVHTLPPLSCPTQPATTPPSCQQIELKPIVTNNNVNSQQLQQDLT